MKCHVVFCYNSFSSKINPSNMHLIRAKLRQDRFWPTAKRNQDPHNHCLWKSCMKKLRLTSVFLVFLLIKWTYITLVGILSINSTLIEISTETKEECLNGWPEHGESKITKAPGDQSMRQTTTTRAQGFSVLLKHNSRQVNPTKIHREGENRFFFLWLLQIFLLLLISSKLSEC